MRSTIGVLTRIANKRPLMWMFIFNKRRFCNKEGKATNKEGYYKFIILALVVTTKKL